MIITADNLPRVIACEGSLAMGKPEWLPVVDNSPQAIEGTACHHVQAMVLTGQFDNAFQYIGRQTPNGVFFTAELAEHVQRVIDDIRPRGTDFGATMYIETQTDFMPHGGFEIHGRADVIIWNNLTETLTVEDAKYGYRIVEPEDNWTLIAHAIGFCRMHGIRPKQIIFKIHQPRPYHSRGFSRSSPPVAFAVLELSANFLATFFRELGTTLNTGPQCHHCPARYGCPAAMDAAMNAIDVTHNLAHYEELPDAVIGDVLDQLDRARAHLETIRDAVIALARHRIEDAKGIIPNRTLEISYGNRKWIDGMTPQALSMLSGVDADKLTDPAKLVSPAQAEKKGVPKATVNALTYRPTTGVRLVRVDIDALSKQLLK